MDLNISGLADAKGTVSRLVLHCRVPPAIKMEHVVGLRQVQPGTTGFQGQDKQAWPISLVLEALDQTIPLPLRDSAM